MYAEMVSNFLKETGAIVGMCTVALSLVYTIGSLLKARFFKSEK